MIDQMALSIEKIALISALAISLIILLVAGILIKRRLPHRLKYKYFRKHWRELQKLCANPETWAEAVIKADDLLAKALKKKFPKGKNAGERLVVAQKILTDNDGVWFAHKLRGKLEKRPKTRLKQDDVKQALLGIGQALKDLGAV